MYTEETNILNELKSLSSIVITRDGMNLRCAEKIMERVTYELKLLEEAKKYIQIERFINSVKLELCLMPNEEQVNKQNNNSEELPVPLIINDIRNCPHNGSNEKIPNHINYVKDFISIFSTKVSGKDRHIKVRLSKLLKEDITRGDRKNQVDKIIGKYMEFIKRQIKDSSNKKLFGELNDTEMKEILEKIENYILRHIYKDVYPTLQSEKDKKFYEMTRKLEWIKPEHLEIKKLYVNQLKFAEKYIKKIDMAHSVYDKLECIYNAYITMNNTVKFISGKNEEAGQDELTPLFQYILIKAHPQNLITNINYIKSLLNEADLVGPKGFYVSQMEFASSFIFHINAEQLKMNQLDFDLKTKLALDKYNKEIQNKSKIFEIKKKS
jgi:hypothetical protein